MEKGQPALHIQYSEIETRLTKPGSCFEVMVEDIDGQPMRSWKYAQPSLRSVLESTQAYGDRTFLELDGLQMSYDSHLVAATAFGCSLFEDFDIGIGDRVAIAMRNCPEWSVAFFGAAAVGAVIVSLNAWWTGEELLYGIADAGVKVLVVDRERWNRLMPEIDRLRTIGVERIFLVDPDAQSEVDQSDIEILADFNVFLERPDQDSHSQPLSLPAIDLSSQDLATIFYTSGTTSRPKGVLGTHGNICSNMMTRQFARAVRREALSGASETGVDVDGDVYLLTAPLFHAMGCHSALLGTIACGGTLLLMHKWDADKALTLIESRHVTTFGGAPTMIRQIIDALENRQADLGSLRELLVGGAPLSRALVSHTKDALPDVVLENGYGMTEASSTISFISGSDCENNPESVGPPIPVCDVKVIGPDGSDLPWGESGELCIRGPGVALGYWREPKATEAVFGGGWLRTGDIAVIDKNGRINLIDRVKDVIIRGGENISSVEVEGRLLEHPSVLDAAVIAVPDLVLGERVGAIVVLRQSMDATGDELSQFLSERMARFKVPDRYWFREGELPRGQSGKILKRSLRDELGLDGL
ncbi:class I adenylate-forming enzyme family protein [Acidithrix sp. C25]|uniref:class I adenylate-forming enzyme family protein n=1 Tax=Acidithrix sp. C25 TaxID=1671482 RepID=UPI00191BA7E6|nr:class I adenylate-forming enzyme family protein [Acidithrix sp. C25]CAG4901974.1 unnamed protein product [Acidithrix sp. C25]